MFELHCHLDGSLNLALMSKILGREVLISEVEVSKDCRSLTEYLKRFVLPISCLQTRQALFEAGKQFMLDSQKENLKYVEARFAPLFSCVKGLKAFEVMEAVIDGMKEGKKITGIDFGVIACAMRNHDPKLSLKMFKEVRDFYKEGLCAVDLAGDESNFPTKNFIDLFKEAKKLDYNYTIHAGECGSVESIKCAIEMEAKRIGHGIAMSGHEDVKKLCLEKGIGIEMCPTSNLQTKAVTDMSKYPLKEYLDYGLLVTINTDNRTVSGISLKDEFDLVKKHLNLNESEIHQLEKNAEKIAFSNI